VPFSESVENHIEPLQYSTRFVFLDKGEDVGNCLSAIRNNLNYSTLVGICSGLHKYLHRLVTRIGGSEVAGKAFFVGIAQKQVLERKREPKSCIS
jgi:hypothetical protein